MPKASHRRQLREAVVQFLYSVGTNNSEEDEKEALDLILESYQKKTLITRCKALLHLQQGRAKRLPALEELVRQTFSLDEVPNEQNPLTPVRDLAKAETAFQTSLESLRLETKGNKHHSRLQELLSECAKHNQSSRSAMARLTTPRPALPAAESVRQLALDLGQQLTTYSDRLNEALSDTPGDLPELAALRRALDARKNFGKEITDLTEDIHRNLASIDAAIEGSVDNYTPDRIDRVDRGILRLGAHEIMHCEEIPPAVAINEAIEISRDFGTTDSPRFINGILDKIRNGQPESESAGNL